MNVEMEFLPPFANDEVKAIFSSLQDAQTKLSRICSEESTVSQRRDFLEQAMCNVADQLTNFQILVLLRFIIK
jgi:hypothetical protein